jgi:hypothetical protein
MSVSSMLACAACFSADVDSPLANGARSGAWLLLSVTLGVQGAFAAFFIQLWRRAKRAQRSSDKP